MVEITALIVCSFLASFGLGIVFQIEKKSLLYAGLGGALTRCVYLMVTEMTPNIFVQCFLAAIFAGLYAELLAMRKKNPSTVFLYPSIIPLIPGSLFYYIAANLMAGEFDAAFSYLWQCTLSLAGICLGFVVISTFTYYRRLFAMEEEIRLKIRGWMRRLVGKKG